MCIYERFHTAEQPFWLAGVGFYQDKDSSAPRQEPGFT